MEEIKGDLFSVLDGEDLQGAALCHCVSSDFEMGKGIAVTFKNMLSKEKVAELRLLHPKVGTGVTVIHHTVVFFNLVTKANYYGKPTLATMRDSLLWMRNECEKMQIKCVCMPRIGCGLDRLNWDDVKILINEVFENSEVKIKVFSP